MKQFIFSIFIIQALQAQNINDHIARILSSQYKEWKNSSFIIQSSYFDERMNLSHYYILESFNQLPIYPRVHDLHLDHDNKLICSNVTAPCAINIRKAYRQNFVDEQILVSYLKKHNLQADYIELSNQPNRSSRSRTYEINHSTRWKVRLEACYYYTGKKLFLAKKLEFENDGREGSWLAFIDAETNHIIEEISLDVHCSLDAFKSEESSRISIETETASPVSNNCYRAFPIPVESPYHGDRSLIFSPWTKATNASPLGWHNDGQYFFYSTIGNNVDAYEDMDGDNLPTGGDAARAFGGAALNFDFSYDSLLSPPLNKNSSITNLFYWSNILHDVWYQYGFNEAAGNFQYNNFNKGGLDLDNVIVEGLDNINASRNNANFSCPPDGYPGRLQMYIWQVPTYDTILIVSPVSGKIVAVGSAISPGILAPMNGKVVLAIDGTGYPNQGCEVYLNSLQMNGNIALVDKGICNINTKITQAQNAGAKALIVCNVDDNAPSVMGGFSSGVGIPVYNISKSDGDLLKSILGLQPQITILPSSALRYNASGKSIVFARAAFGAKIPASLLTNEIKVLDNINNINDACDPIQNNLAGTIALIEDGGCEPSYKAYKAQQAGASAVIIGMNVPGLPYVFSSGNYGSLVNIPVLCVSQVDYQFLLNNLPAQGRLTNSTPQLVDADFDGGIISHEYAHGISIRLTGGPNNNACLINAEQAGEGWSDFFALAMTMKPSDVPYQNRGVATWPSGQSNISVGIRPYPYTVDMNVNPATYGMLKDIVKISQPHGIGYVWCSMIWDMCWALTSNFGFEPDIYKSNSSLGNIKAFNLIISGLKLQVCNPGFVDSRNAILKADSILYGGADACIIWNVFARRGLGFSANQGSAYLRDDGIQAFDLPPGCSAMSEYQLFGGSLLDNSFIKLTAITEKNGILLNWNAQLNSDIKHWRIFRKSDQKKEEQIYTCVENITRFVDEDVDQSILYHYQVRTKDIQGREWMSNWAVAGVDKSSGWNLFPNPVTSAVFIQNLSGDDGGVEIELFDNHFRKLERASYFIRRQDKIKINTATLIPGIYILKLSDEKGTHTFKFIKQ